MIKVSPTVQIPESFAKIIECLRDGEVTSTVDLFSGRNSGKTYNMTQYAIILTFEEMYNNVLFLRATKSQIANSIFSQCINIIKDLRLEPFFKIRTKKMEIINIVTQSTIYFDGIDEDPYAIKGFTPYMNKLALIIFEEFTELSSKMPIDIAVETLIRFRGSDKNNGVIKIVKMGNPSRWNNHWSWDDIEIDEKSENTKTKVFRPLWIDIKDYLNPHTVDYIENVRKTNPRYYEFAYLGRRMSYEGLVYPQFDKTCFVTREWLKEHQGVALICGLDPASKRDKTAFTINVLLTNGVLVCLDMWCYNPKEIDKDPLSPSQQTERFMDYLMRFKKDIRNYRFKDLPTYIVCDPANGGMDLEIKLNYSKFVTVVNVDKKERLKDIERNTNALALGKLKFLSNQDSLKPLIDEISTMIWREKVISKELKAMRSTQLTIGEDDCHDSMTYALRFALNDARFVRFNSELFIGGK